jgi:transcriptional regulator with XRE-family HTH domain
MSCQCHHDKGVFMKKADQHPLRQLRQSLGGISQERLAHRMGVTTRTVARWEKDPARIPTDGLMKLRVAALELGQVEIAERFTDLLQLRTHANTMGGLLGLAPLGPEEIAVVAELLTHWRRRTEGIQPILNKLLALSIRELRKENKQWEADRIFAILGDVRRKGKAQ